MGQHKLIEIFPHVSTTFLAHALSHITRQVASSQQELSRAKQTYCVHPLGYKLTVARGQYGNWCLPNRISCSCITAAILSLYMTYPLVVDGQQALRWWKCRIAHLGLTLEILCLVFKLPTKYMYKHLHSLYNFKIVSLPIWNFRPSMVRTNKESTNVWCWSCCCKTWFRLILNSLWCPSCVTCAPSWWRQVARTTNKRNVTRVFLHSLSLMPCHPKGLKGTTHWAQQRDNGSWMLDNEAGLTVVTFTRWSMKNP